MAFGRRRHSITGFIGSLCVICMMFSLCSCSSRERPVVEGAYRYVIGVSQANMTEPWRYNISEEITRGLESYPDMNAIFADATQDTQKQEEDIRRMMVYGIDLLIVTPQDLAKLRPLLEEVCAQIPVIMLGSEWDGGGSVVTIQYNDYLIGQIGADYIGGKLLPNGGNVILIEGMDGSEISARRARGFYDAIAAYPKITSSKPMVADWLRDKAEDRMKDYLVLRDDVDVVFALNDEMAYGASIAASKLRFHDIRFVGVDGFEGENGGISLVNRGALDATLRCPSIGRLAFESAVKLLAGEKVDAKTVIQPTLFIGGKWSSR